MCLHFNRLSLPVANQLSSLGDVATGPRRHGQAVWSGLCERHFHFVPETSERPSSTYPLFLQELRIYVGDNDNSKPEKRNSVKLAIRLVSLFIWLFRHQKNLSARMLITHSRPQEGNICAQLSGRSAVH